MRAALQMHAARRAALREVSRRALSSGELRGRLERQGHEREAAAAAVASLNDDGWLDDAAYAESLCHEILRRGPASAALLVQRLEARGIDAATAERAAAAALEDADPVQEALEFARQRTAALRSQPPRTAARRIAGQLARRGFDDETVAEVINRLGLKGE